MARGKLWIHRTGFLAALLVSGLLAGCAATPSDSVIIADARASVVRFVDRDPGLQEWVNHAHGFAQIIFFQDEAALRTFQRGNFEFSAQATAVAATAGKAATTSYEKGVAVFIMTKGGLMAEATIGAQKFDYESL
jgi:predicted oxidoreductase (fatty acid repression mutant protein)